MAFQSRYFTENFVDCTKLFWKFSGESCRPYNIILDISQRILYNVHRPYTILLDIIFPIESCRMYKILMDFSQRIMYTVQCTLYTVHLYSVHRYSKYFPENLVNCTKYFWKFSREFCSVDHAQLFWILFRRESCVERAKFFWKFPNRKSYRNVSEYFVVADFDYHKNVKLCTYHLLTDVTVKRNKNTK